MTVHNHRVADVFIRLLLHPLLRLLRLLKKMVERLIGHLGEQSRSEMIEEEIQSIIDEGVEEGVIDESDEELFQSVIEFGDTLAREVMVPRTDMETISVDSPLEDVHAKVVEVGHTRLPVYRETVDRIVGILHSKDLLKLARSDQQGVSTRDLLRPVLFIPVNQRISILLREFKKHRTHMAIVVDDFGGTAGLITLEDLVEEIIGEVADEFGSRNGHFVEPKGDGWVVDGRTNLEVFSEKLGVPEEALQQRGSETVGGLMSELLGRLPKPGEEVSLEGFILKAEKVDNRRVRRVAVRRS